MAHIELIPHVTPDGRIVLQGVARSPGERVRELLRRLRRTLGG
jgi:hypothetical protein